MAENTGAQERMEFAGVDPPDGTVENFETAQLTPPEPPQPQVRQVTLQVPAQVSDEMAVMAYQIGMQALQEINNGVLLMLYPNRVTGADGKVRPTLGRFAVMLKDGGDIKRMLDLGIKINQVNYEFARRSAGKERLATVGAEATAEKAKDNAARDAQAKAGGNRGGIIVP